YQKPHFEIQLVPDKADLKTGEAITGQLQLSYPDGKPVTGAQISLSGRAQQLTMVDGELGYAQALPLKLDQQEIVSDARGQARFRLPPSEQPSRLVLSALATDGAAWRVRVTRELLVERGSSSWSLRAPRQFSAPGEAISFRLEANARSGEGLDSSAPLRPASWEWIRLENRSRASGPVSADNLALTFSQPGSYSLLLKDAAGRVVGAGHHWVSGAGLVAPAGHIQIVTDKPRYRSGETASVLISFPEAVDQALLTLERDRVEAVGLLGRPAAWLKAERLGPTQWRLAVPVKEEMSPNMTFSVAYVRNGDYVFQNAGLLVEQPRIEVAMRTDKAVYGPGETVQVDVDTRLAGQPVAAEVAVGVVDEMIYVLQPEIAPSIDEFFFHPRRNNVRTSASLSFIGYDVATGKLGQLPARRATGNQRAIKLLERPRRDDIDTAAWQPRLQTDAQGHARFSFVMPDALTRWRITGRAMDTRGRVGQQLAWLRSDKSFYAKWTAPDWLRSGDQAQATLALFNQTGKPAAVQWQARVGAQGPVLAGALAQLQPGINHVQVALPAGSPGGLRLLTTLSQGGTEVDRLETAVQRLPATWLSPRALRIDLANGSAALALPPDASRLQVSLSQDPAAALFSQRLDELIDYPWGCVEQTASRLLPLGLALQSLGPGQEALRPNLQQRLATARLRLAQMAGPKASFGWWGLGTDADAFLTLYAYYADARALQALGAPLPPGHGPQMMEVYARGQSDLSRLQRALALGWMQELGLPTASLVMSLAEELAHSSGRPMPAQRRASLVLTQDGHDLATVVVDRLVRSGRRAEAGDEDSYTRATLDDLGRAAEAAARRLQDQPQILARAGLLWSGRQPAT
ncbi:MAG: alpha-2-macroglobulin family protein, partial [Burkholderiaceae bacterium]|nr:alpha-2-macroglobulin family protein [Burkholderiaceae bacterium]